MAQRGAKRSKVQEEESVPYWKAAEVEAQKVKLRESGNALMRHLLGMYAVGKMTAMDFSIACHHADGAGVRGADFEKFALPPGQQSGMYQRKLDKNLPPPTAKESVQIPCCLNRDATRGTYALPVALFHERLADELRETPGILKEVANTRWPRCYEEHPLVLGARREGLPDPLPLAVYTDGVRYGSQIAGRSDSVWGVWVVNLVTHKRHLVTALRSSLLCRCGCKGWCSVAPIWEYVAWGFRSLAAGVRPPTRYNGELFDAEHPLAQAAAEKGASYEFQAVLLWVKGDWAEASKTLGLASVSSANCMCPFCVATNEDAYSSYEGISRDELPWAERAHESYQVECTRCERVLQLREERDRQLILAQGELHYSKGKRGGRILRCPVPSLGLEAGMALKPSQGLLDIADFEDKQLPLRVVFWKSHEDDRKRTTDPVTHRNPIFSEELGTSPARSLAVDLLHTVYYGPMMRWTSAALWRVLLRNPWGDKGPKATRHELGVRRLRADMLHWFQTADIAHADRIGDLTVKMLGDAAGAEDNEANPHGGGGLKLKAHETCVMSHWALDLVRRLKCQIPFEDDMVAAGQALQDFLNVLREAPLTLPPRTCQRLFDLMQTHLVRSESAKVHDVPKYHACIHLAKNAAWLGNPRCYSTFVDEGLNLLLRQLAERSHRMALGLISRVRGVQCQGFSWRAGFN